MACRSVIRKRLMSEASVLKNRGPQRIASRSADFAGCRRRKTRNLIGTEPVDSIASAVNGADVPVASKVGKRLARCTCRPQTAAHEKHRATLPDGEQAQIPTACERTQPTRPVPTQAPFSHRERVSSSSCEDVRPVEVGACAVQA